LELILQFYEREALCAVYEDVDEEVPVLIVGGGGAGLAA
jgi:hypothetical protein